MKTRRDFIKSGLALGAALPLADFGRLFAASSPPLPQGAAAAPGPVVVAVRNGDRPAMLDRALAELGGIGAHVKAGQTVVIKANLSFDAPPGHGSNTHPDLLRRLVVQCAQAGARSVTILDHTLDPWQSAFAASGADAVARETGAILVSGDDEGEYRQVDLPSGRSLRSAQVHRLVLDSDVFLDVPVLKHHGGARMTAGVKNLMGIVWDRPFYHRTDLHQCIADFLTLRKPALTVIDAYHPMVRNGPRGRGPQDVVEMRMLIASTDVVAADAAASRLLGHEPSDIRYLRIAAEMGLGVMDFERMDIRRHTLA